MTYNEAVEQLAEALAVHLDDYGQMKDELCEAFTERDRILTRFTSAHNAAVRSVNAVALAAIAPRNFPPGWGRRAAQDKRMWARRPGRCW